MAGPYDDILYRSRPVLCRISSRTAMNGILHCAKSISWRATLQQVLPFRVETPGSRQSSLCGVKC